ncbi:MAG: polysaccharide deacetylase family protein [Gemmatimonadales bacterium]
MRPRRDPVPRARDAWVWLGGIALLGVLGGGVTAAAVALWERIDIRQLVPQLTAAAPGQLPVAEPPAAAARDPGTFEAVLFVSARNAAFFPDSSYHDAALESWRDVVLGAGGVVREAATAAELAAVGPDAVLVLAEAPCLSTGEMAAVRAHLRAGGGVVSNWAVGARDERCEWRGWGTVAELTGAEDVREIPARDGLFLTVPGGVGLSAGLDPGTRIELRPDPSIALWLTGPRVYWSDWALNPAPDESGGGADGAAVVWRTPEGGRSAWFGLRLSQAVTESDSLRLRRLVQNGILWAAGTTTAAPAPWPGARRSALVFAFDVEDQARSALDVAAVLREQRLPASFYAVSQIVEGDAELAETLAATGEVGSQTSDHTPLLGLTPQDQRFRLRRSWDDIESWAGTGPAGLHPPEETFDESTLEAWRLAGGTYVLAHNEARSASPEMHRTPEGLVVLLPRLLKDDYNLIVQDRVIRASVLAQALVADTRKLHAIGGLAIVAGHSQIMRAGPRLDAIRAVAEDARAEGDWWIAPAADVAAWWSARSRTRLSFVPRREPGFLGEALAPAPVSDVLVTAPDDDGVRDLWVDVVLPRGPAGMVPLVDGEPVGFETTGWGMRVPIPELSAADTARISFLVEVARGR